MHSAYVDESEPLGTGNGGPYVMVATIPLTDDLDEIRDALRALKPKSQNKLHWYESVGALRKGTVQLLSSLPLMHWAIVATPDPGERAERTRRACMTQLLWELEQLEMVSHVVFESRGAADDARDLKMIQNLRASRTLRGGMRVDHVRGASEPLLWIPDAVCGAVNGRLYGPDLWAGRLDHQLWIIQ